jgi:hypothetical protein
MALNQIPLMKSAALGSLTKTAGTKIQLFVPPLRGGTAAAYTSNRARAFTKIFKLRYTSAVTQHVLSVMRSLGYNAFAANAAIAQAVIVLQAQPVATRAIAANDWLAWENATGGWDWGQVSSVSGSGGLTITMVTSTGTLTASGLPTAVSGPSGMVAPHNTVPVGAGTQTLMNPGGRVWLLGINPTSGSNTDSHPTFNPTVSSDTTYGDDAVGWVSSTGSYEPLLVNVDNVTNAGTIQECDVGWTATG